MKIVATVVAVLSVASLAAAQDDYLPLREGLTWTYDIEQTSETVGAKLVEKGQSTLKCVRKDGEAWLLKWHDEWEDDEDEHVKVWVKRTGTKIEITEFEGSDMDTRMLPADFSAKKCLASVKCGDEEYVVESVVGEEEEIEVPAGKFKCIKVRAEASVPWSSWSRLLGCPPSR